jgi:SAM-dependent methyltransferase
VANIKRGEPRGKWPKQLPSMTSEQQIIRDDFMNVWLETLPKRYGLIERFNHNYPIRQIKDTRRYKTLDIGAGRGEHLHYENLSNQEYVAIELREELLNQIQADYPSAKPILGDIQARLDFPDHYFDRILAIHVLEHLPNLPSALDEIQRLLAPNGMFSVLIPCDPGFAYGMARNISARRIFEKRYKQSYDWCIASEHINSPQEIIGELEKRFKLTHRMFFPLRISVINFNLVIGLTLIHRD